MYKVTLALLVGILLSLMGCQSIQKRGDGIHDSETVFQVTSTGIAGLLEDNQQIYIARQNLVLNAVAVLFEVEIDGVVVGNLGNGEKAAYPVKSGLHKLVIRNRGPEGNWTKIKGEKRIKILDGSKFFIVSPAMGWTHGRIKIDEVSSDQWQKL